MWGVHELNLSHIVDEHRHRPTQAPITPNRSLLDIDQRKSSEYFFYIILKTTSPDHACEDLTHTQHTQ